MRITFLGAADTVTGSRHLVDAGGARILLDCGLFQGYKTLRQRYWAALARHKAYISEQGQDLPEILAWTWRGAE